MKNARFTIRFKYPLNDYEAIFFLHRNDQK